MLTEQCQSKIGLVHTIETHTRFALAECRRTCRKFSFQIPTVSKISFDGPSFFNFHLQQQSKSSLHQKPRALHHFNVSSRNMTVFKCDQAIPNANNQTASLTKSTPYPTTLRGRHRPNLSVQMINF